MSGAVPRYIRGISAIERVRSKLIADANGCLLWWGAVNAGGYGIVRIAKQTVLVHRFVKAEAIGRALADDEICDHTCRNRRCANPAHVRVVDRRTNAIDNSLSQSAIHAKKPVCPRCGGEYTVCPGKRRCDACTKTRRREYYLAHRSKILAEKRAYNPIRNARRRSATSQRHAASAI